MSASVRASSVCGTCMFISSPSKSALYGLQTDSLNRNVLHGIILACIHGMKNMIKQQIGER